MNILNVTSIAVSASEKTVDSFDAYDETTLIEALKNGGKVVLWQDITTGELAVEQDSSIDLNGYKLTAEGIVISAGKTFTIMDSQYTDNAPGNGKLISTGKEDKAGIQTTEATLIVESGVVVATGSTRGAGIGGSGPRAVRDSGTVIIENGVVTATGGNEGGAGIGGGAGGIVDDAELIENGGNNGEVIINSGTVVATGGSYAMGDNKDFIGGAGIGGGSGGLLNCNNVSGWIVIDFGEGGNNNKVTINGGTVVATGGNGGGAGIGGGGVACALAGSVVINDGIVKVKACRFNAYDIGGGSSGTSGELSVNGGTLEFCTDGRATNMPNLSFKNCIVIGEGECQYEGRYDENGEKASKYVVTFKNGDVSVSQKVYYGEAAIAPEWERTGYTLTWNKEFDYITDSLTVDAVWIPKQYTVVFKNGEEILDTQQVEYLKSAIEPTEPTKEGYRFNGWNHDFSSITSDLEVSAKWLINKYEILAVSGNGGAVSGGGTEEYNTITELTAIPDAGYKFEGWYENDVKVSSDTKYSFLVTMDRTLEARFILIELDSISIDGEQQLEDMFIVECDKNLKLIVLPNPVDAIIDETKVQWITSDSAIATVENGIVTGVSQGYVTISASFEEKKTSCVVTVIPNRTGRCYECVAGKITVECWNCSESGKVVCSKCKGNGNVPYLYKCDACKGVGYFSLYSICAMCKGECVKWNDTLKKFEICNFCYGKGEFSWTENCSKCEGKGEIISSSVCIVCHGYGQYTCKSCYGSKKCKINCWECNGEGRRQYSIYSISYDANGGANPPYSQVKIEYTKLQISNQIPAREGYEFCGWALDSSANIADYMPGDYITEDKSIKLYAVWEEEKTLSSISITQMPYKVNYIEGENFDSSGLIVTAHYSNDTTQSVTDYEILGYDSTPGEKRLRITYNDKTVEFTVIVKTKIPQAITSNIYKVSESEISRISIGTLTRKILDSIKEKQYVKVFKNQTEVKAAETIGTGMIAKIMDGNMVVKNYKIIVTGDVNGDGNATVTDMLAIKAHLLGKNKLLDEYATAADTSGDNAISITDFIQIKAKVLGKGNITAR